MCFQRLLLRCVQRSIPSGPGDAREGRALNAIIGENDTRAATENGRLGRESTARVRWLVARAQRGDGSALEDLYVLHFDRVYGYLQLSVGNRHDAEDLTNQTFVKMLESIDRFVWRQAPFSAWLFRIAHNLAIDHFRAGRRWHPEEEPREDTDTLESSAEDEAFHTIDRESMLEMIEGLSPDQRQVLTLKFVFDFSNTDVATILGKTEGAIKSLQHRALAAVERSLTAA